MNTTASSSKGLPSDDRTSDDTKDSNSSSYLQDDEDDPFTFRSRKSYPQRNNRPKLNYRDLERGVYDAHELRQSKWALGGPAFFEKNNKNSNNTRYSDEDDDDDDDDVPMEEENTKSNDDTEQLHRRLWCICKKPWDHSKLMLRCDSCANWYHGDCIGVTKEQARVNDMNGDQFVCPPCQGNVGKSTNSTTKPGRLSDESMLIKRKRIDTVSPSDRKNGNTIPSKNLTHSEPSKRPKTGIFFQRDSTVQPQIHCIVHGCSNWAKSGWVYCSPACIRRHINETLQAIQRSKGVNNDNPPSREDILLYENRTKKVLDRKLVPKVEDLCTWINQHPSYEIVKPALKQSILLTANESKSPSLQTGLIRSTSTVTPKTPTTPTSTKPKLSWAPITPNIKSVPIKKAPVQLNKQTSNTPSSPSVPNYADIRVKVPQALYDKLLMRLEKSGEKTIPNEDMKILVDKIEEEMYRVYGKVDNSYKNKFRSLLANISNMNNNFFYKHILSKEVTPKQIVAMKPEDMLPPEEKEKRKDDFVKEVQMIMQAEEQTAEEMARRAKTKNTRQGLIDNDAVLPMFKLNEQTSVEDTVEPSKPVSTSKIHPETKKTENKIKKPVNSTTGQKPKPKVPIKDTTSTEKPSENQQSTSVPIEKPPENPPVTSEPIIPRPIETLPPIKSPEELPKPSSREEPIATYTSVDIDNDYIEPESPTGIDALLYDDDDDTNGHSRLQQQHSHPDSPSDNNDYLPSAQQPIRDDYNPLAATKPKSDSIAMYQPTPISRSSTNPSLWRGIIILPPDAKLPCQSVRIYGESDYLINDIPEQLAILGRLKLADLWDYVRDSLAVRDVIILTLISSNPNDNNSFLRYVDTLHTSKRAAVINKRSEPSVIRDMYVLAADTKDCSSNVLSALSLSTNIDPKQLFLVVIGSGKKSMKSSMSNLTYKPVSLQDPTSMRDPRLLRTKDPRLGGSNTPEPISNDNPIHKKSKSIPNSTEDLLKIMSDSLEHIRHSTSMDEINTKVMSTLELLKSNNRDDLCTQYSNELQTIMSKWKTGVLSGDNLNEENMEVDDEQDDKNKKQLSISEFNDVDYRFLDQDMDHRITIPPLIPENEQRNDVIPKKSTFIDTDLDFRTNDT